VPVSKFISLITGTVLFLLPHPSYAKKDAVPLWLDTIAPVIKIEPQQKWHSSVFYITLTSNESATLWISQNGPDEMKQYLRPVAITEDGTYSVYFYGEDEFGNRSKLDSAIFVLDSRAPSLSIDPQPRNYPGPVKVKISSNEPCRFFYQKSEKDSTPILFPDSFTVKSSFEGYLVAVDSSENRTISGFLRYTVDTSSIDIVVNPRGGVYNRIVEVSFDFPPGASVYYTLDPLAPPKWFKKFEEPISLPHGLSILRYYGKSSLGTETAVYQNQYAIDTIPPKLHFRVAQGHNTDTLFMTSREKSVIRFTRNRGDPDIKSEVYSSPIVLKHRGKVTIRARAWDEAGSVSEISQWSHTYDLMAPKIQISNPGGRFNSAQTVYLTTNEEAKILYTLDNTPVSENSMLYTSNGVVISKEGHTVLRYIGIDEAGNVSEEFAADYYIDTRPPVVRIQIEGSIEEGSFRVSLSANEPATIYYQIGGADPTKSSPVYSSPISMTSGQVLKYLAVDSAGNAGSVGIMNELKNPMISASPDGGVYNQKLRITFSTNTAGTVYWRILPDTVFKSSGKEIVLSREGHHSFEYYLESEEGVRSPVKRNEYVLDWTPPRVNVNLKKGLNDSVIVFLQCSENATIYYTVDGTNPMASQTARTAGNKFLKSSDRLIFHRRNDLRFAFYAEDAAGNQSAVSIMDIFSPRAVPNVPAGPERLYDRILSVTLNAFDQSTIYFERHGKTPTIKSPVFQKPLTLMESDTILAFVVDASGFKGEVDTFIYRIDLPPSPMFTLEPETLFTGTTAYLDASLTIDKESPPEKLLFRWDFDGDGKFDTEFSGIRKTAFNCENPGKRKVVLEVMDENKRVASFSRTVNIRERCPQDMVSITGSDGKNFCIDRYEYPNIKGREPLTNVSWVEAKMSCIDAGKRLCTSREWMDACQGAQERMYPYGQVYDPGKCPTEGKRVWNSGHFRQCNQFGINDMIGNVWEWVEDRDDGYPQMMGGSFRYGIDAQCKSRSSGTVGSRSDETGFRCCK